MIILSKGPAAVINEICDKLTAAFGMTHIQIDKTDDGYELRAAHVASGVCPNGKTAKTRNFNTVMAIKDELLSRGVGCQYNF